MDIDTLPDTGTSGSGGLMNWITGLGGVATGVIGALRNDDDNDKTRTVAPKTPTWLMPVLLIGGGIVALVLIVTLFRK